MIGVCIVVQQLYITSGALFERFYLSNNFKFNQKLPKSAGWNVFVSAIMRSITECGIFEE